MTWSFAAVLAASVLAQRQGPLARGAPEGVVGPAPRVHLVAHEDLEPDLLRSLARRDVTLWLETRSNTLRESTLEHVARFDDAYVQLHAPLRAFDAATWRRMPRAGVWVTEREAPLVIRLPGPRRVALELAGALTEGRVSEVAAFAPAVVRWVPEAAVDVLQWGLFAQLRARRVAVLRAEQLRSVSCDGRAPQVSLELDASLLLSMNGELFSCSRSPRVVVAPSVEPWLVQSLVVREPSVELVIRVGASDELARQARGLLEVLGRGPPR